MPLCQYMHRPRSVTASRRLFNPNPGGKRWEPMYPRRDGILLNTEHKAECDSRTHAPSRCAAYVHICTHGGAHQANTLPPISVSACPRLGCAVRPLCTVPHPQDRAHAHTMWRCDAYIASSCDRMRRYGDCFKQGLLSPRNYPQFYPPGGSSSGSTPETTVNRPQKLSHLCTPSALLTTAPKNITHTSYLSSRTYGRADSSTMRV